MLLRLADLRYAARLLSRAPGFTVAAVTALALGIGVNSAIFSIVNEMLFRPLPVRAPEQIVTLSTVDDHVQFPHGMSYVDFLDHRAQLDVFDDLLAYTFAAVKLSTDDGGERMFVTAVSGNYFSGPRGAARAASLSAAGFAGRKCAASASTRPTTSTTKMCG